jgi:tetratricopeptide (TPR) repeat protein
MPNRASKLRPSSDLIEQAIYTRQEFFGADAIVPLPTAEARQNLLKLLQSSPNDPAIIEKLTDVEEKLGNYDAAEKELKQLVAIDGKYANNLTSFYERRGRYADEAALLRQRLATLMRTHDRQFSKAFWIRRGSTT